MSWFKNLKIKTKFSICFGIISILVFFLGLNALITNKNINNSFSNSIDYNKNVILKSVEILERLSNLRTVALNYYTQISEETVDKVKQEFKAAYDDSKNALNEYLSLIDDSSSVAKSEQFELAKRISNITDKYYNVFVAYIDAVLENDMAKATKLDYDELTPLGVTLFKEIYTLPPKSFNVLDSDIINVKKVSNTDQLIFLIIFLIIQVLVIFFGYKLSDYIRKPIEKLKDIALKISKGNLDDNCRTNTRDEIGDLSNAVANMSETFKYILDDITELTDELYSGNISYRININRYEGSFRDVNNKINIAVNVLVEDSLYIIDRLKDFGNGNFDVEIKEFPGEKIVIKDGITTVQTSIRNIFTDVDKLIDSANNGDLEFRLDTSTYIGQWKDTVDGLNQFVENVVSPIKETQNALNQFSLGNFTYRVTNEYRGEFNNIKQTLNYTAETVGSYISEISDILKEMSNKNFDVSIDREYVGDFKQIQTSVNLIVNNLNLLTKDIILSAEQVSMGAKQISQSSITLSEGVTEQAAAVEELTATVSMISKQSRDNVLNAEKASGLASESRNSANDGSRQMNDMLIAMEEINNASNGISNIIKVIDDIAFQTNILALNAAVEAARAGEHGKGFAVVAEEVRSLAARSQQAAKETTQLIESSVQKVLEGSKIANNTSESLINIVTQIEEISNLTTSCAVSSKEQEASIEQITEGISQIASVTQSNTAISEEAASASEELSSQAQMFYSSVSDFKLKS